MIKNIEIFNYQIHDLKTIISQRKYTSVYIFICFFFLLEDSPDDDGSVPDIEIDIPPGKCRWFYSTDSRRNTDCSTENLKQQQNKSIGDNHRL